VELAAALSQKDFRRYIEGWKTRVKQCVASDGSYIEGDDLQIQNGPRKSSPSP